MIGIWKKIYKPDVIQNVTEPEMAGRKTIMLSIRTTQEYAIP
jgi:hypothetical protein